MTKQETLDLFGERYIYFVRDTVLTHMKNILENTAKAPDSKLLAEKISNIPEQHNETIKELVYNSVDSCLHYFLFMFDEYGDDTNLMMQDDMGNTFSLAEISDGLCGELYTEDGWIERFSKYPSSIPK